MFSAYLMLFHGNNGYGNVRQYYVVRTLVFSRCELQHIYEWTLLLSWMSPCCCEHLFGTHARGVIRTKYCRPFTVALKYVQSYERSYDGSFVP